MRLYTFVLYWDFEILMMTKNRKKEWKTQNWNWNKIEIKSFILKMISLYFVFVFVSLCGLLDKHKYTTYINLCRIAYTRTCSSFFSIVEFKLN